MSPGTYDDFESAGGGDGAHHFRVPYHLAPVVEVAAAGEARSAKPGG